MSHRVYVCLEHGLIMHGARIAGRHNSGANHDLGVRSYWEVFVDVGSCASSNWDLPAKHNFRHGIGDDQMRPATKEELALARIKAGPAIRASKENAPP